MTVLRDRIETVTTDISDGLSGYRDIETHGYTHKTVNHTIGFVDVRTGAHTSTTESTWRHVKAFLNLFNRLGDNIYHPAHYMFPADC
jgi:phage host-nuclease inhibitor protein Gam